MLESKNNKEGTVLTIRLLSATDSEALASFFSHLGESTKVKFEPHPLTVDHAKTICQQIGQSEEVRFVALVKEMIVGYFLLDFGNLPHEIERYAGYGTKLDIGKDVFFAPCISDGYQNSGVASAAMEQIISHVKQKHGRSLVLLGGTQETNTLGLHFYKKWQFKEVGRYFYKFSNIDMKLDLSFV